MPAALNREHHSAINLLCSCMAKVGASCSCHLCVRPMPPPTSTSKPSSSPVGLHMTTSPTSLVSRSTLLSPAGSTACEGPGHRTA